MSAPAVRFEDGLAVSVFAPPFDLDSYRLFLAFKSLPEKRVDFLEETHSYQVSTPARFAHLLGVEAPRRMVGAPVPLAGHLWDYQAYIVPEALEAKRYAVFADCGMGKTAIELEFARQVVALTNGRVLILTLPDIVDEIRGMAEQWYGQDLAPERIETREALIRWCRGEGPAIGITNYQKLIPGQIPEFRHLAGLVADESSVLKSGGGTIKWNLIKGARGIEYKLSCTATPAPNEAMEYASQGSFLERLRSEGEIIWTYFSKTRDGEWYIKPHAKEAFYRFLATWSIYLRDPSVYGFRDNIRRIPEPIYLDTAVPATGEQLRLAERLGVFKAGDLFSAAKSLGVVERAKLSEAASGFLYHGKGERGAAPMDSLKPQFVVDLLRQEAALGGQTIIWANYLEETRILAERFRDARIGVAVISGDTPKKRRTELIRAFQRGDEQNLMSKDSLIGFGLNFPAASAHLRSSLTDSFERFYQSTRRSYRYGQTGRLRIYRPYVPELEGATLANVDRKAVQFESDALEQQRYYAAQMRERRAA